MSDRQGKVLVYLKSHLSPGSLSNYTTPNYIQSAPFELNLRKEKWMFKYIYRPTEQNKQYFLEKLSMTVYHYWSTYDNRIILGGFNMKSNSPILISSKQSLNLFNISQIHVSKGMVLV